MQSGWKPTRLPRVSAIFVQLVLCGLAAGCGTKARALYSPPLFGDPTHPPAVRIIEPSNGATFQAHADIHLLALATPNGTDLGPDEDAARHYADPDKWNFIQDPEHSFTVEFLAGTNDLGSQASGMVSASMRSQHGEAVPMIAGLVGYPAVAWVWHDAPAGSYTLTANATNEKGLTTVSPPVKITILP
jgi:hypothetical protein